MYHETHRISPVSWRIPDKTRRHPVAKVGQARDGEIMPEKSIAGLEDEFWRFSLAVYGGEEAGRACLGLQDRLGADVNLLLFCCWLGVTRGRLLRSDEFGRLIRAVAPWRNNVVEPLRAVRRYVKQTGGADTGLTFERVASLKAAVADNELRAERVEQGLLIVTLNWPRGEHRRRSGNRRRTARENLDGYVAAAGLDAADDDRRAFHDLVAAACRDYGD